MSTMADTKTKRTRRSFTEEFKAGAVRLVLDEGKTVAAAARDLGFDGVVAAELGRARPGGSDERQDGSDDGGARGARAAPERIADRPGGARNPEKSGGLLREAEPMRFTFIAAEKAEHTVTILCRCLRVTRSGFYAWQRRPESTHARDDRRLKVLVQASFDESQQRYGSPRIHEDLIEQHEHVSRKRVIRLMQEDGLQARARKRYKVTTMSDHDQPVAANLLDRQFTAEAPNQRWVSDTTEFVIGSSGKLYLAAILDLFSRFIVGWAVSAVNDRHLTIKALEMALKRRCPEIGLAASLRPGLHLRERGLPGPPCGARHRLQHEPARQLLRQCRDGELLLDGQERARRALRQPRRREDGVVRLHRSVL